jgi:hypothetical protein
MYVTSIFILNLYIFHLIMYLHTNLFTYQLLIISYRMNYEPKRGLKMLVQDKTRLS